MLIHVWTSYTCLCVGFCDDLLLFKGGAALYDEAHRKGLAQRVFWTRVCGPNIETDTKIDTQAILKNYDVLAITKTRSVGEYTYDFLVLDRKGLDLPRPVSQTAPKSQARDTTPLRHPHDYRQVYTHSTDQSRHREHTDMYTAFKYVVMTGLRRRQTFLPAKRVQVEALNCNCCFPTR